MLKMSNKDAIYDARTLGGGKMLVLGVQHMFAMFGATVLVPLITGLSVSATLLFAGLGTLLFHLLTKGKIPAFLGSSFAFLGGYAAIAALCADAGVEHFSAYAGIGVACAGLLYVILAGLFKIFGAAKVMKFFPPIVTGPIIIAIGLILSKSAIDNCTANWWLAILLFTAVTKVILLPISLWCQKNSIKMVSLMPEINRIKVKYFGDKETIGEEQVSLFKREHYHGFLSIIPLAFQLIILIGLINVIYTVAAENPELAIGLFPYEAGGLTLLFPLAAGVSAWLLGIVQNRIHPLQKEQSRMSQMGTNGLSIGISLMLGIFVSLGVGFYWICSNLLSIFVLS